MKKIGLIILGGALIMSSTSCVTKKKFLLAENGRIEALSRGDKLQGQLNECHNEMASTTFFGNTTKTIR